MRFDHGLATVFFLVLFLILPTAAEARGGLEPVDFTVKGAALGDGEEKMLAAFGKPDFDKERMGKIMDIRIKSKEYTARAGVRYGATAYKLRTTFGEKQHTFLDGDVCCIYENPQDRRQRLIFVVEPTDGSLLSWRLTSLPLTEEEADALTEAERSDWENTDLQALSLGGRDIDTSALGKDETPALRWEVRKKEAS